MNTRQTWDGSWIQGINFLSKSQFLSFETVQELCKTAPEYNL